ncbi:retrovirus-related pol polyprotein from transposon TNT 1-94 [Tanacetum coccineum]
MDVKTAFLHGTLNEDVYVCQTEGFINADHPSHVNKLKKALYGLKQALRAWYDELSTFLLHNYFFKGTIDPTLFIRCFDNDILVVPVYVDDIIFGSTHPRYTQLFSDIMKSRFKMSMMGEMTFFLGLQVNQSPYGIFINQSNYVLEILKKYGMETCDPVGTPMEIKDKLDLDQNGTPVDATKYRSMIGALMYLTSSRPKIVHATCLCARYQAKPTEKHLKEIKMIFRYLWGTINMGLWYTKDSGFELTGFSDVDYAGCKDTFKREDKYVADILKKFDYWSIRTASTPIESNKPLVKDEDGEDVDVHVYRSIIGCLMYLITSRPDIMFAVCACARFQVTPKASHLNAVKRIFSDYGGASLDKKSTTGGCQFLGCQFLDYPIWEVIQNGNGHVSITTDTQGQIKVLPPRTAEEILARERERKARNTLLMALPEDHLAKFHKMTDAKEM